MTFNPQVLQDLEVFWSYHHGVNLGVVGDAAHAARSSYHNGWDVASKLAGSTDMATVAAGDYSYRLKRDQIKSNAASAIDLGKLNGTYAGLQDFSRWLVAATRADPTKYRDVREIIYSPDGKVVKRWDNNLMALRDGGTGTGQGDDSHLYHTHISWYRDSEFRDKRPLFSPYFDPALPDSSTGGDMTTTITDVERYATPRKFTIAAGATVRGFRPNSPTPAVVDTFTAASMASAVAKVRIDQSPDATVIPHGTFLLGADGEFKGLYIPAGEVTLAPAPAAVDCSAVVEAARKEAAAAAATAQFDKDRLAAKAAAELLTTAGLLP